MSEIILDGRERQRADDGENEPWNWAETLEAVEFEEVLRVEIGATEGSVLG